MALKTIKDSVNDRKNFLFNYLIFQSFKSMQN